MDGFRLDGKRALVTGASSGIGRATATAFAAAGAHVVVAARRAEKLAEVVDAIAAEGGSAEALPLDVAQASEAARAIEALPAFDILFDNAGVNAPQSFLDVDLATFDHLWAVNVRGAFAVMQAVARGMVVVGRGGSIVVTSSQMGHVGGPRRSAYCTTKHAVEGMVKAAAIELAPHRIRVNTVAPTFVETELTRPWLSDPAFVADLMARIPMARGARPDEIAAAVLFLASDASAMVTGTSLRVDGGWTAQ